MSKDKEELKQDIIKEFKPVVRKGETAVNIEKEDKQSLFDSYLVSKIMKKGVAETNFFKEQHFSKDYDETDLDDFIQAAYTTEVIRTMFLDLKVAGLFTRINVPRNPFKIPTASKQRKAWLKTEGTTFTHKLDAITSGAVTFDVKTLMTAAQLTDELEEDSIVPVLPILKQDINDALQYSIEDAIVNGAISAVGWDNDLTDADDSRHAWDGLRKFAIANAYVKDLSTFSTANLLVLRTMMGKYGVDPAKLAILVSPLGYSKLLGLAEVITLDKYGPQATILTGEQGKFLGTPIILSEAVREDVAATGINTGVPNDDIYTTLTIVYRPAFSLGVLRDLKLEPYRDPTVGNVLYVSTRQDFQARFGTEPTCVMGIKIS